jgi:hypothetical protein
MKKYLAILVLFASFITACTSPSGLTSKNYEDDIYYSSKDAVADKEKARVAAAKARAKAEADRLAAEQAQQSSNDDYYSSKKQADVVQEEPFDADDYYDYEYATRLRRFHNNCGSYGYYDNYYTNSYWYSGNPYNYGTSVYMGYNFWGPSYVAYNYYPSYSWFSNYGWGYDPWYNPYGYYNPYAYNQFGFGYNPYMNGYYNGFNNGYYNGFYDNNYFNSYDNNSYYYGPRQTLSSNSRSTSQPSLASRYVNAIEKETAKPFEATMGRDNNPYAVSTTVTDYMSKPNKPTSTPNPGFKPVNPSSNTEKSDGYTRPENTNAKDDYYSKPTDSKQINSGDTKPSKPTYQNDKPRDNDSQNKPQQPVFDQPKPRTEQPKFEPRSTPSPSVPRNNSPSSAPQPRKR